MSLGIPATLQGKCMARSSWPRQNKPSGIFYGLFILFYFVSIFCLICLLPVCFDFVFEFFGASCSFVFLFSERERKTKLGKKGGRENLGGVGKEENMIKVLCLK